MSHATENKNLLQRYVAALQAGDTDAVRTFFTEDATWTLQAGQLPMSGTWEGRDQIMDGFFATAMTHYEPGSVELEVTVDDRRAGSRRDAVDEPRAHPRRTTVRERLHRRVHTPRRRHRRPCVSTWTRSMWRQRLRRLPVPAGLSGAAGSRRVDAVPRPTRVSEAARGGRRSRAAPRTQSRCRRRCSGGGERRTG